jgi:hypothetical protein
MLLPDRELVRFARSLANDARQISDGCSSFVLSECLSWAFVVMTV